MKNIVTLALIGAVAVSGAAFAQSATTTNSDIGSDVNAIRKDNVALSKDYDKLHEQQADKAAAKANGDPAKQAADSVAIGATRTEIGEKKAERDADRKILNQDERDAAAANAKMQNGTSNQ